MGKKPIIYLHKCDIV